MKEMSKKIYKYLINFITFDKDMLIQGLLCITIDLLNI